MQIPLTRRWRSKTFDEIIGQDIAIRLIKNSLYKGFFFPVYLFAGQRGCGKTTMGRVFAGAINCAELERFQSDPIKVTLPCGSCSSCRAIALGEHPDFLEIDAASHTGVDNVRQIIESASFLPILGRRKIYLVDEAHMLSKAAFNACLKMLEEPPANALFILATTEPEKIPETVRSRTLQLFFGAVNEEIVVSHLERICMAEKIVYDREALVAIVRATDGSVRDAVNSIEQVSLTFSHITLENVQTFSGRFVGTIAEDMLKALCTKNISEIRTLIYRINTTPDLVRLGDLLSKRVRDALWQKLGVPLELPALSVSAQFLQQCLEALAAAEIGRISGRSYRDALECALLGLFVSYDSVAIPAPAVAVNDSIEIAKKLPTQSKATEWEKFIALVEKAEEPLVTSIFKQAIDPKRENAVLSVKFPKELSFFEDLLSSTKGVWSPLIMQAYGSKLDLVVRFDGSAVSSISSNVQSGMNVQSIQAPVPVQRSNKTAESVVTDPTSWPTAATLLEAFPGTLTKIS